MASSNLDLERQVAGVGKGAPFSISMTTPAAAPTLPEQAGALPEALQTIARQYIGARQRSGEALLEAARWISEARAIAKHGEWQLFLEATGTSAAAAKRLLDTHATAIRDPQFAEAVRTNWISATVAAELAQPSIAAEVRADLLSRPEPPTRADIPKSTTVVDLTPESRDANGPWFWAAKSVTHPTAHCWHQVEIQNKVRYVSACGLELLYQPTHGAKGFHCGVCEKHADRREIIPIPGSAPAAQSEDDLHAKEARRLLRGLDAWHDSIQPDVIKDAHKHALAVKSDALRSALLVEIGAAERSLQGPAPAPENPNISELPDDAATMQQIRERAAELGLQLAWEDDGVILCWPGEDLEQLRPLSFAEALDFMASGPKPPAIEPAPEPAPAGDGLPGVPCPLPSWMAGKGDTSGFTKATREQLAALGWEVCGKHSGDERTTPWLDLRKNDDPDVVRRLTQDQFRVLLGRPTSAELLAKLDALMPDDLFKAGYYWRSAEPPTAEHVDGWTGEAPTAEGALQLARDRARVIAERVSAGVPPRPPRPTSADPSKVHPYLVALEKYADALEQRIAELTARSITTA